MGVIVNLVDEVRLRLETAIGTGKSLADVKRVMVGFEAEARGYKDLPVINISPISGELINEYQQGGTSDSITMEILMIYNKLDSTNKFYNTTTTKGALYYLEAILNAVENNTSDVWDIDYAGKASRLRNYNWNIDQSEEMIELKIQLTIGTIQFYGGNR